MTNKEFPEKWAVPLTDIVKQWVNDEFNFHYYTNDLNITHFHFPSWTNIPFQEGKHTSTLIKPGYTLITEQEFIDNVLKEELNLELVEQFKNKEIAVSTNNETFGDSEEDTKKLQKLLKAVNIKDEFLDYSNTYRINDNNTCVISNESFIKKLPLVNINEFFKSNKMNRFPFKLKEEEAKKIIKAACSNWKTKLLQLWAIDLVDSGYTIITENDYKDMRKACTESQNLLFDEIFGKDIKKVYPPSGTVVYVRLKTDPEWFMKYFSHEQGGNLYCFSGQRKEGSSISWDIVSTTNPLTEGEILL